MKQPIWVARQTVDEMHADLLAEHGGAPGLRDEALLESALARPRQIFAYADCDLVQLAAAYVTGIVKNHPFVDGNKRTAYAAMELFLWLNGLELLATDADCVITMLGVAAGDIKEAALADWLKQQTEPIA